MISLSHGLAREGAAREEKLSKIDHIIETLSKCRMTGHVSVFV